MKKTLRIMLALALVIAALSVSVSAAGTNGFYDIGSADNVTITPYAGTDTTTAVPSKDADVDADDEAEVYYEGSDRLGVTLAGATENANYGVILVAGNTLPTASSDIYYIDQVKAEGESIAFEVYPKTIEATKAPMTLYISSSDADEDLVSVPMNYVFGYVEEVEETKPMYGDVNGNGGVNEMDLLRLARYCAGHSVEINEANADVNGNGSVNEMDLLRLARYCAGHNVVLGPAN